MATAPHRLAALSEICTEAADWVRSVQQLTEPDRVYWCDGSQREWQELTGLPFVFGVWAVRRAFAAAHPEATAALHGLLLRSRAWGLEALPQLARIAAASFHMTSGQILAYFHQLNYALDPEHEAGLAAFFRYLHGLRELEEMPRLEYFGK